MTKDDFPLYSYRGYIVRVIDGDTVRIRLDLGLLVTLTVDLRIAGVNAPEIVGATRMSGEAARDWLAGLLGARLVYVQTFKDARSFVRFIADCYFVGDDGALVSVSNALVEAGHAVRWEAP